MIRFGRDVQNETDRKSCIHIVIGVQAVVREDENGKTYISIHQVKNRQERKLWCLASTNIIQGGNARYNYDINNI